MADTGADLQARATVDAMEGRLLAWAAWLTAGGNGSGYPGRSVLHQSWLPPAPGAGQGGRVSSDSRERVLDAQIRTLNPKLRAALAVVYLMRASKAERMAMLGCQEATVRARVRQAKRVVALALQRT